MHRFAVTALLALSCSPVFAELAIAATPARSTVCTITVNSDDEREAFRRHLPADRFEFVELVERGRPDWLASACRRKVRCDVLLVSGHFAGTEFYSSKAVDESLRVEEMERVSCGAGCPDLFAHLKEVYLFGCDTLKAEPVKSATPEVIRALVRAGHAPEQAERVARALSERHAEGSRERMRRIFPGVPVIYGFQSLAPYGRISGPMLSTYFLGGEPEIGTGRPSPRLVGLFAPASMVVSAGMLATDPLAQAREQACRFHDDRTSGAAKLEAIHAILGGDPVELRMAFDRVERFFASRDETARAESAFAAAFARIASDHAARERYLAVARDTGDPAIRVRMIALARAVEWLSVAGQRAELGRMVADVVAANAVGFGEVDLICSLNRERELDGEAWPLRLARSGNAAQAAALACMGSTEGRARVLKALASHDEQDVQVAQAFLRHRPVTDAGELRTLAFEIARMKVPGAQVRALDTLARHRIADREIVAALAQLFRRAPSLAVQRAIAEVFIRADVRDLAPPGLAATLRAHRLKSPGGEDLIDVLIARLE